MDDGLWMTDCGLRTTDYGLLVVRKSWKVLGSSVGRQIRFTQIYPGTHPDFSVGIPIWVVPISWVPTRADSFGYCKTVTVVRLMGKEFIVSNSLPMCRMCLSVSLYMGCCRHSRPGRPPWYVCYSRGSGYSDEYSDEYSG